MIWDSTEQELRVRLAHRVGRKFSQYKRLAEWLDCYTYVLPNDRTCNCKIIETLSLNCYSSSDVFLMWQFITTIETTLTKLDQDKLSLIV